VLFLHQSPLFVVTRDAVSYPDHVAHYVLGVILAHERHLIEHHYNQQNRLWYGQFQHDCLHNLFYFFKIKLL